MKVLGLLASLYVEYSSSCIQVLLVLAFNYYFEILSRLILLVPLLCLCFIYRLDIAAAVMHACACIEVASMYIVLGLTVCLFLSLSSYLSTHVISRIAFPRAVVSLITYNGYFQEYTFSINNKNESSWSLDREFNLLTFVSDSAKSS